MCFGAVLSKFQGGDQPNCTAVSSLPQPEKPPEKRGPRFGESGGSGLGVKQQMWGVQKVIIWNRGKMKVYTPEN